MVKPWQRPFRWERPAFKWEPVFWLPRKVILHLYGKKALETTRKALKDDGVFAVWTEFADPAFEKRLGIVGFDCQRTSPGKGGPRHIVYLVTKTGEKCGLVSGRIG